MTDSEKILALLERVDSRLDRLEQGQAIHDQKLDSFGQILNSHSQILNSHSRILDSHSQILNSHSQILDSHSQILDSHSQILNSHSQKLDSYGQKLDSHGQKLDSHGQILALMENEHGQKLKALFDGQSVNHDVLKRIEADLAEVRSDVSDLHVRLVHQELVTAELRKAN